MILIYEVMAIENSYPLFFLEHMRRFHHSINSLNKYKLETLISIAVNLIKPELSKDNNKNIKLVYNSNLDEFYIERNQSRKPEPSLYNTGVTLGIVESERINPLIKQENKTLRIEHEKLCLSFGYYDILLVNNQNEITEGSRSNFLCIDKNGSILTSPIGVALNGITREIIFDICKELHINVIEQKITIKTLENIESLIITGTSPEILPIKSCNNIMFNIKNKTINILTNEYKNRKLKDRYITEEFFK